MLGNVRNSVEKLLKEKVNGRSIIFNPFHLHYSASMSCPEARAILDRIDAYLAQMKQNPDSILYQSLKTYLQDKPDNRKAYTPLKGIHFTDAEKKWLAEHDKSFSWPYSNAGKITRPPISFTKRSMA